MSPGTIREATATTRSLGTARGGSSPGSAALNGIARHEDHVVAEQETPPQPGAQREQAQAQAGDQPWDHPAYARGHGTAG